MKLLVSFALCQVPFGTRTFYSESSAIWRGERAWGFVSESSKVTMCGVALRSGEIVCSDEVIFHATVGTEIVLSGCVLAYALTELSPDKNSNAPLLNRTRKQTVGIKYRMTHSKNYRFFFFFLLVEKKEVHQEHLFNLERLALPE